MDLCKLHVACILLQWGRVGWPFGRGLGFSVLISKRKGRNNTTNIFIDRHAWH